MNDSERTELTAEKPKITILEGVEIDAELAEYLQEYAKRVRKTPDSLYTLAGAPEVKEPVRQIAARWLTNAFFVDDDQDARINLSRTLGEDYEIITKELSESPTLCNELSVAVTYQMKKLIESGKLIDTNLISDYATLMRELMASADEEIVKELFGVYPIGRNGGLYSDDVGRFYKEERIRKLIEDSRIALDYRMECTEVICGVVKSDLEKGEDNAMIGNFSLHSLGWLAENIAKSEITTEDDETIVTAIIAFLEMHVSPGINYVRVESVFPVANRITSPGLQFEYMQRHVFQPAHLDFSKYCRLESDEDLASSQRVLTESEHQHAADHIDHDSHLAIIKKVQSLENDYSERVASRQESQTLKDELLSKLTVE